MNIVVIIQARMASSRLPGKVLREIAGKPMLAHVVERARKAKQISSVWVATTIDPSDDPVEALCGQLETRCYRGSMHDVLDRYYQAAKTAGAEVIVRLTADCPLIDPGLVEATLEAFLDGADFAANRLPPPWTRSFPIGLDTEICSYAALERTWKEADQPYHREHVLPYLYEGVSFEAPPRQPEIGENYVLRGHSRHGFHIAQLHHHPDYGTLRWTVDTPADLELVQQIFSRMTDKPDFSWLEVIELFKNEPQLAQINADVQHKTAYDVDPRMKQ